LTRLQEVDDVPRDVRRAMRGDIDCAHTAILDAVLAGELEPFTAALQADERRRRLAEQAGE